MHNEKYWTVAEIMELERVNEFNELAQIGLIVLDRMSKEGKTIVQICGPMSTGGLGSLKKNMDYFQYAVRYAFSSKEFWYLIKPHSRRQ